MRRQRAPRSEEATNERIEAFKAALKRASEERAEALAAKESAENECQRQFTRLTQEIERNENRIHELLRQNVELELKYVRGDGALTRLSNELRRACERIFERGEMSTVSSIEELAPIRVFCRVTMTSRRGWRRSSRRANDRRRRSRAPCEAPSRGAESDATRLVFDEIKKV